MTDIDKLKLIARKLNVRVEEYGNIVELAGREYHVNEDGEIMEIWEDGECVARM